MVVDQISNLITSLKNASKAGKDSVTFTHTKLKAAILDSLVREGYIVSVEKDGKGISKTLVATLANKEKSSTIEGVKRVSKFSRRIYKGVNDIRPVKNGSGTLILSTPKGIISDKEARKNNIGGEALFEIW